MIRPVSVNVLLNKHDHEGAMQLVKCVCSNEMEVSQSTKEIICTKCNQSLNWGLRKGG